MVTRCCCLDLKTGCFMIGVFYGLRALIMIMVAAFFTHLGHQNEKRAETEELKRLNLAVQVISIIMIVFSAAEVVSNILLSKATMDNRPKLMIPWMVLCIVDLIFSCLLFVSAIVFAVLGTSDTEFLWSLFAEPLNIGLSIYFHLVVHSYYKLLTSIISGRIIYPTESRPTSVTSVSSLKPESVPPTPLTQYLLHVPNLPPIQHPPAKSHPKIQNTPSSKHFGSEVSLVDP